MSACSLYMGLLTLGLPLCAALAASIGLFSDPGRGGILAFGLMAPLYLVTEELLVETDKKLDCPWIRSLFFVGFLAVLLDQVFG